MANRYWVYNGGNINDTTHWSATSGGAGGASKPTLSDNVIFDANSFTLNAQVVTLNEAFNCLSIDWIGITKTVTFSSSVYSLNLYGNLTLATGLTWTFTGTAYLNHKSSGTVTTNGIILNANRVYFDAAGITVTNGDAANYGGASFYLTNGTWNTNGKTITSTGSFNTVAGTKVLTLGASVFNIGTWTNAVPTGFTFNYNTSTVVIATASILTGITTFYNLTCSGVTTLTLANNITVTNALTLAGSSVGNRLKILSSVAGTQRTVTVPAAGVFPSNIDVQDTAFPNAVDMSAIAGYSQDFGNNTGITFTASANLYFKHTSGAANWGDITKWFLADRSTQGRIPLIQDDVNFDNLSFTGTSTLSLNIAATCRSMNWAGLNQAVTLSSAVNSLSVYGHTTLSAGLIWIFTGTAYTYMVGVGSWNITTSGIQPGLNKLYFDRVGGTWTNQDDFNVGSSYIGLASGTWNTAGKTVTTTGNFEPVISALIPTLTLGTSIFNCNIFNSSVTGTTNNLVLTANSSTIKCTQFNNNLTASQSFNNVECKGSIQSRQNHTYRNFALVSNIQNSVLSVDYPVSLITVSEILTIKGIDSQSRVLVYYTNYGTVAPVTINAGVLIAEYINIQSIKGLGTANWDLSNVVGGSSDLGKNLNITFSPGIQVYFKHTNGAVNWTDPTKWVTTSGGSIQSRIPLIQDVVIFDANSFTGASNITITIPVPTLDFTNISQSVTLSGVLDLFGSFILPSNVLFANSVIFDSLSDCVYNAPHILLGAITLACKGVMTLNSDFSGNYITAKAYNEFRANGFNVTISYFNYYTGGNILRMGSGIWTIKPGTGNDTYPSWFPYGSIYSETSTLIFAPQNTGNYGIDTYGLNKLIIRHPRVGSVWIGGFVNNFICNDLTIEAGSTVKMKTASTPTMTLGKLTAIGTQSQPITIGSVTAATHNLIKTGADMVEVEYCNISNSNATPTDKWAGGDTSVDGGGNSGWTFKYIPIIMWFFGIFSKK